MRPSVVFPNLCMCVVLIGLCILADGCSHARGVGPRGDYALPPQARPLEVPTDLDLATIKNPTLDSTVLASAPTQGAALAGLGLPRPMTTIDSKTSSFLVQAKSQAELFSEVGKTLSHIDGLQVASQAEEIGAYKVRYQGTEFVVKTGASPGGMYDVRVNDLRGMPALSQAPMLVLQTLKQQLHGR